jgi:hypothetical protein
MDAEDEEISPRKIGLSEGVIEYYKSIGKELYILYDYVSYFYEGFASVKIVGKGYNFINTKGELLWKEDNWFDYAWSFHNGLAEVEYKGNSYILNKKGELYDEDGNRVNISIQESKSGVIRLTESDIHNLVIKTLKEYLY